jgi:hypothetical protein
LIKVFVVMANIHGLFSNRGKRDDENDDDDDDANNRYVGGIGARGGGRYDDSMFACFRIMRTEYLVVSCIIIMNIFL